MFKKNWVKQFAKFAVVGTSSTVINLILLYLLVDIFLVYYLFSAIIAFFISTSYAFVFDKTWTFNEKLKDFFAEKYFVFFTVYTLALFLNLIFLYILVEYFDVHYLLAQLISVTIIGFLNFLSNKFYVFGVEIVEDVKKKVIKK